MSKRLKHTSSSRQDAIVEDLEGGINSSNQIIPAPEEGPISSSELDQANHPIIMGTDPQTISDHLRSLNHHPLSYYMQLSPSQYESLQVVGSKLADLYDAVVRATDEDDNAQRSFGGDEHPDDFVSLSDDVVGRFFRSCRIQIESHYAIHFHAPAPMVPHECTLAYRLCWYVAQLNGSSSSRWYPLFRDLFTALTEFNSLFTIPQSLIDLQDAY